MNIKINKFMVLLIFAFVLRANAQDSQNINKLLNNQVIVSKQIMCVLEKSPCDSLGMQLKGKNGAIKDHLNSFFYLQQA